MRIFQVRPAVGADISKLTVTAHFDIIFFVIPVFFKIRMVERFFEGGIFDIAKGLRHGRTVADIAFGIDGDFPV